MPSTEKLFSDLLRKSYKASKDQNPRYSLRAFARKMGLSISTLSEVLNSKTKLSKKRMTDVVNRLDISDAQKKRFARSIGVMFEGSPSAEKTVSADQDFLSNWLNRALLIFFDTQEASQLTDAPRVLAKRFDVSIADIKQGLSLLVGRGMLIEHDNGTYSKPSEIWKTSDEVSSEFVKNHHRSDFDLGLRALEKIPVDQRDFTSMMFAGDARQVAELKAEIRRFYDRALLIMENGSKNEVFQMSINLFPIHFEKEQGK